MEVYGCSENAMPGRPRDPRAVKSPSSRGGDALALPPPLLDCASMGRKLLRAFGMLAYAALVVLVFGLAAYLSFSAFVRSGVIPVPSVLGMTSTDAGNVLIERGLALRGIADKGRYDDNVPAGRVLRQIPDAHTFVKRGSRVQLILSKGPQRVEVPALLAKTFPAAQVALSGAGLTVGTTLSAFVSGQETGTVVTQDPDPGAS